MMSALLLATRITCEINNPEDWLYQSVNSIGILVDTDYLKDKVISYFGTSQIFFVNKENSELKVNISYLVHLIEDKYGPGTFFQLTQYNDHSSAIVGSNQADHKSVPPIKPGTQQWTVVSTKLHGVF